VEKEDPLELLMRLRSVTAACRVHGLGR
jgi:hypothetical protein